MSATENKFKIDLLSYIKNDTGHESRHIRGNEYRINPCPICGHKDHFTVYKDSNSYSSFSGCCKGGSIVDYLMEGKKMNKADALKEVDRLAGSSSQQSRTEYKNNNDSTPPVKGYDFSAIVKELSSNIKNTGYFKERGLGDLKNNSGIVFGYDQHGYNHALRNFKELRNFIRDTKGNFIEKAYKYFIFLLDENNICRYFIARRDDEYIKNMDQEQRAKYPKTLNLKKIAGTPQLTNERYLVDASLSDKYIFITESWGDSASIELLGFKAIGTNSAIGYKKAAELIEKNKDFLQEKIFILAGNNDTDKNINVGQDAVKTLANKLKKLSVNHATIIPKFNDFNQWLINDKSDLMAALKEKISSIENHEKEIEKLIEEESDEDPEAILHYNFSDVGNAERIVSCYGDIIRFNVNRKKQMPWLIWNDKAWEIDNSENVYKLARDVIRHLQRAGEAIYEDTKEDIAFKKQVRSFVLRSENDARLRAMLNQAHSFDGIPITENRLDCDKYLLNCQNGTLDLRTGQMKNHCKEDLITKIIPIEYKPNAECQEWKNFLNRIFLNDSEIINYIQKAVGYSLTGETKDQSFFMLYGNGSNGKSTFLKTIQYILGNYSDSLKGSSLMAKYNDEGARGDLAKLQGSRFVWVSELNENQVFDESLVKSLTGGEDPIPVRFMYSEEFTLLPQFKLWMGTNKKPVIKGSDDGIWRRVRLIPFDYKFSESEKDEGFFNNKILPEMSGILNWCIEGCLKWLAEGMKTPKKVQAAVQQYKNDMDVIQQFIDECCVVNDKCSSLANQLYKVYQEWCLSSGEKEMTNTAFGTKLGDKGFDKKRISIGITYRGIGIRSDRVPDKENDLIEMADNTNPFCQTNLNV